jgi:DNA-directed RNA polymerase specialized sigma24 family protein
MNIHADRAALWQDMQGKAMRLRTIKKRKPPMKPKRSRFDSLVACYYPAVYSFASRLTDDPREAVALTREAFNKTRKQLQNRLDEAALASILISAVIRADLTAA